MTLRVGVIGAGAAGLIAARTVQRSGAEVVVFDKGRRPGGRANTREHGSHRFDHGAQYFTLRDDRTRPLLDEWRSAGVVEEWAGRLVRITSEGTQPATKGPRFVGVPGMIAVAEHLARGLDVRSGARVDRIVSSDGAWRFFGGDGSEMGRFDRALVALPAPQAVPLLDAAPELQCVVRAVEMAPCWAGMFVFGARLDLDFDGAFLTDGALAWIARDSSKPGRPAAESWVLHATPEWTHRNRDADRDVVSARLKEALAARFGPLPPAVFERAHRWGYAQATSPFEHEALYDERLGIGVCGDWCAGGRVEGALLSGLALAGELLEHGGA